VVLNLTVLTKIVDKNNKNVAIIVTDRLTTAGHLISETSCRLELNVTYTMGDAKHNFDVMNQSLSYKITGHISLSFHSTLSYFAADKTSLNNLLKTNNIHVQHKYIALRSWSVRSFASTCARCADITSGFIFEANISHKGTPGFVLAVSRWVYYASIMLLGWSYIEFDAGCTRSQLLACGRN
jgi:hypothetical protein